MTLYEFSLLGEIEQMEAFWNAASVGERLDGDFIIACRQIDDFYVEYHVMEGHYINMRVFKNPDFLQPYLDKINIDFLFGLQK